MNIIMQVLGATGYQAMYPFNPALCLNATLLDTSVATQYNINITGVITPITSTIGNSLGIISFIPNVANAANAKLSINGSTALAIKMANGSNITAGVFTTNQPVFLKYYNGAFVLLLTKASVGLGNVDNTSDVNKPISTAVQTALNNKLNLPIAIPSNSNLNNYATAGFYYNAHNDQVATIANVPTGGNAFYLIVETSAGVAQTCTSYAGAHTSAGVQSWRRTYYNGSWSAWTMQGYVLWGTGTPSDTIGLNGNIYIKYS